MTKPNVTVTLANNSDAEDVQRLVLAAGFEVPGLDWSNIYPHWLVAKIGDRIVGCMEVLLGRPVGRLEVLSIDQDLNKRERSTVLHSLIFQGMLTLRGYGAELVASMIPFENKAWKKVLVKRGGMITSSGHILVKRLV